MPGPALPVSEAFPGGAVCPYCGHGYEFTAFDPAAVSAHLAECPGPDDEPELDSYDPGPEVDDEGGMSEYRHLPDALADAAEWGRSQPL